MTHPIRKIWKAWIAQRKMAGDDGGGIGACHQLWLAYTAKEKKHIKAYRGSSIILIDYIIMHDTFLM